MSETHLVFLPDPAAPTFFLWKAPSASGRRVPASVAQLEAAGTRGSARIADEALCVRDVDGIAIPLLAALPLLSTLGGDEADAVSPSLAAWSGAAKLALDLVGRGRLVPQMTVRGEHAEARWRAALAHPDETPAGWPRWPRLSRRRPTPCRWRRRLPAGLGGSGPGGRRSAGRGAPAPRCGRRARSCMRSSTWRPTASSGPRRTVCMRLPRTRRRGNGGLPRRSWRPPRPSAPPGFGNARLPASSRRGPARRSARMRERSASACGSSSRRRGRSRRPRGTASSRGAVPRHPPVNASGSDISSRRPMIRAC
jgi:hypothetical protein